MEENNNQNQYNKNSYWDRPFEESEEADAGNLVAPGKEKSDGAVKKETDNIKKYKDQSGLTVRKLDIGLWYIEHKNLLRKILIGFLIFLSAVSWPYVIYSFAYYLSKGMEEDRILVDNIVNTGRIDHSAIVGLSPKDLSLGSVSLFSAGDNKYDFLARVQNPNDKHGALFNYSFLTGAENTKSSQGFILPGETKYLLSLGNEFASRPSAARLQIGALRWVMIDAHEIADWKNFSEERLNINISGAKFTPASQSGLSDKINLNSLEFSAANDTVFNYWNVDFNILLYSGQNIAAVNKYSLSEFMSGETRQAQMSWSGAIGNVNKIEVVPEINILEDDIYIGYEGGAGEIK